MTVVAALVLNGPVVVPFVVLFALTLTALTD